MPARKKVQVSFDTANEQFVMPVPRYEHRIGVYPEASDQVRLEWARTQPGNEMKEQSEALEKALGPFDQLVSDLWLE